MTFILSLLYFAGDTGGMVTENYYKKKYISRRNQRRETCKCFSRKARSNCTTLAFQPGTTARNDRRNIKISKLTSDYLTKKISLIPSVKLIDRIQINIKLEEKIIKHT